MTFWNLNLFEKSCFKQTAKTTTRYAILINFETTTTTLHTIITENISHAKPTKKRSILFWGCRVRYSEEDNKTTRNTIEQKATRYECRRATALATILPIRQYVLWRLRLVHKGSSWSSLRTLFEFAFSIAGNSKADGRLEKKNKQD